MNIKRIKDEGLYRRADVITHRLLDYLADEKTSHIGVSPALIWVEVAFLTSIRSSRSSTVQGWSPRLTAS